jgi:hypothetical protein
MTAQQLKSSILQMAEIPNEVSEKLDLIVRYLEYSGE